MINEQYKAMLRSKSVIRELSEYAVSRGQEIGYENVFDYTLGNPSVPCPKEYTQAVIDIYNEMNPMEIQLEMLLWLAAQQKRSVCPMIQLVIKPP